jgi:hypothetical protein
MLRKLIPLIEIVSEVVSEEPRHGLVNPDQPEAV